MLILTTLGVPLAVVGKTLAEVLYVDGRGGVEDFLEGGDVVEALHRDPFSKLTLNDNTGKKEESKLTNLCSESRSENIRAYIHNYKAHLAACKQSLKLSVSTCF